jgi:hypothetical protein
MLSNERKAHRVSEQWCAENGFETEDNPDVLDSICKVFGKPDKEFVKRTINDELEKASAELKA